MKMQLILIFHFDFTELLKAFTIQTYVGYNVGYNTATRQFSMM